MASKFKKAIGAVKDQTSIGLAKVSITTNNSSNLEIAVLKATTHDNFPIEEKYVHEIVHIVSSNKTHAASCARLIGKRIGRTRNWIVATKSLMLVLRIFQDGDPYFPREVLHAMKRGAKILNLSTFRDGSWDFTSFVRTFALYLDERLECFLTGKLQRRYSHGGAIVSSINRSKEPAHDVKPAMLIDKISYWQRLLERAIATRPTGGAKTNVLVQIALHAIVQESFELYKDISNGLTLILDSFFHLHYQNCVSAFHACVEAAKLFKELSEFYSSCKGMGIGRTSEYPSVQTISEELIGTLREFLKDQSSFPSRAVHKPTTNRFPVQPAQTSPPLPSNVESTSSLEDLINATAKGTTGPAISIDLEAYSPQKRDHAFEKRSTCHSTRSLPVSMSMTDVMSLADWSEQQDDHEMEPQKHQDQNHNGLVDLLSSGSENWEMVLAATISSSAAAAAASPQPLSDNNTNTFSAYPKHTTTALENWELVLAATISSASPQTLKDNNTNTFSAYPKHTAMVEVNHYNPFLQDPIESTSVTSSPTFQAIPTFSNQASFKAVQNIENDPFDAFSTGLMFGSSMSRQNLLREQQLWLQNQNKIIAKIQII